MEFHISRAVRESANVDQTLFSYTGNVVFANVAASRQLAEALNKARGPEADPAGTYNAGALFAMGLIDELSHALVAQYRRQIDPNVLRDATRWFANQIDPTQTDPGKLDRLLLAFTEQFPNAAIFRGEIAAGDWLRASTEGRPNREAALEELLMLWIANLNPAFKQFKALFEDTDLKQKTAYPNVTAAFPDYFRTRPPVAPEVGTLFEALRAPSLAAPDSLTGQLEYIREHWAPYIGDDLRRILLAIDVLREEDLAIWLRFHPPGPDQFRHGAPQWGDMGFVGDEFIGFDEEMRRRKRYAHDYQAPLDEYEAFSADQAWMPNVVLMAKSTYVWLEQLSKKYQRHIHRLDQIPDEELRLLASRGITGLWLIGLWERSVASRTIKRLRGHHDAVASAYSLKSYDIAEDLGGWLSYNDLKQRAAAHGLRLASDMVPNHMGLDSPWVIEHPDWFISRWDSPYPSYSFNGPDLSTDSRVEIKIEDHYYDQSDAAVAFRLRHHASGETRYVYHGNDGTSFAWNDTAQLDYSKAYVREHVIQVILHVARLFPIIRFDAAMVLAKRHVQRLWFPLPGAGGSIPSRAESAMSQEEFNALMPHEFWREVVDRVAAEVPGTLLLAEAFWLLEGYFVRTLGMHRVYNSAFMNMLRDEENAKFRSYLKKTLEFDPDIMKRYVNFMSNPDERTAIDQFGSGDKYFGVCTLLATLPGLPMFGHGQIEGYTERYGMEFKTAKMDEWPNEGLVARHMREIAPLLHKRHIFAGSSDFTLYDFWNGYGSVDENVFAYSNRHGNERSLVVYNNRYDSTHGTIHISAAYMDKGSGNLRQRSLSEGLSLPMSGSAVIAYRDNHGLEYLRRASDIHWHGMSFDLHGFQCAVLLDWRELWPNADWPWDRLCDQLAGRGVSDVHEEMALLRLRPLHDALREALSRSNILALAEVATEFAQSCTQPDQATEFVTNTGKPSSRAERAALPDREIEESPHASVANVDAQPPKLSRAQLDRLRLISDKSTNLFAEIAQYLPQDQKQDDGAKAHTAPTPLTPSSTSSKQNPAADYVDSFRKLVALAARLPALVNSFSTDWPAVSRPILPAADPATNAERTWPPILAFLLLRALPERFGNAPLDIPALFDRLLFRRALADIFATLGLTGEARWQAAAQVRLLLTTEGTAPNALRSAALFHDPDARWLAGVHDSGGTTYFNREQFEDLTTWLQLPTLLELASVTDDATRALRLKGLEASIAANYAAARDSGYNLNRYLAVFTKEPQPAR
ncbi:MAG TPA: alpha-amylase family glycosyl hydrolase [Acidobacteriaceae bacterium]|nr:alpha-amylase family glycosyl hydrolase [Acidobacteriaceae bacterium]